MKARKASTPAKEIDSRGLVPQGEGGTVVRIPRRQVHQASPISYTTGGRVAEGYGQAGTQPQTSSPETKE